MEPANIIVKSTEGRYDWRASGGTIVFRPWTLPINRW